MSGAALLLDASERGRILTAVVRPGDGRQPRTVRLEAAVADLDTGLPGRLGDALEAAGGAGGLSTVVVTMGPGSYVGVRAAAAAAAGLSEALAVPLHALSSLELAATAAAAGTHVTWAAVDAGRGWLYVARVRLDPVSGLPVEMGAPERVEAAWEPPQQGAVVRLATIAAGETGRRAAALAVDLARGRPPLDLATVEPITVPWVQPSDPCV